MRKPYISIVFFCIFLIALLVTRAPIFLYIIVPYTLFAIAVNKYEGGPGERLRVGLFFGFNAIGAVILFFAVAALVFASTHFVLNPFRWLDESMFQEDFATAQPMIDSLRGEFAKRAATASACDTYGWRITYQVTPPAFGQAAERNRVNYADWHNLDWLSQEAADAIRHLTSPQTMHYPIDIISTTGHRGTENYNIYLWIEYIYPHGAQVTIFNSPYYRLEASYIEYHAYLGDGYRLVISQRSISTQRTIMWVFLVIGGILLAFAVLFMGIGWTYKKQEAKDEN